MTLEELRHVAEEGFMAAIPKLFAVSAAGNVLIAGLSFANLISIVAALVSLIVFMIVSAITISNKRKAGRLLDMDIAERQRKLAAEQAQD